MKSFSNVIWVVIGVLIGITLFLIFTRFFGGFKRTYSVKNFENSFENLVVEINNLCYTSVGNVRYVKLFLIPKSIIYATNSSLENVELNDVGKLKIGNLLCRKLDGKIFCKKLECLTKMKVIGNEFENEKNIELKVKRMEKWVEIE